MWNKLKAAFGLGHGQVTEKMNADHQDARKRFVWCVLAVSPTADSDPAYRPAFANTAIREWYGMESHDALLQNIDRFLERTDSTPAYNAYRAVFMARAGFGAGMLSEAESWEAAFKGLRKLQRTYPSWNEYGRDYLEGQIAYRQKQGVAQDELASHRREIIEIITKLNAGLWAQTPFNTPV